jgi:hypothetical protein
MMPVWFGEAKSPIARPIRSRSDANIQYWKFTGRSSSRKNASAASSIPPVANGRAPNRSESQPESGPATRKPTVSGSM